MNRYRYDYEKNQPMRSTSQWSQHPDYRDDDAEPQAEPEPTEAEVEAMIESLNAKLYALGFRHD
jgi:hypothetical protein